MDTTEDLSARVLLRHILSTEPPRTPITRSVSKAQSTRRSRLSNRDAGTPAPQGILRRSIKRKMRESITRKSLPATTRRNTNTAVSLLFDDGDTPRNILRNILQTDPVKSPVVHEEAVSEEPQLPSSSSSFSRKRSGTELSGLDLPDLTIGNAASTAKGLRRKRPRRSLNVTDFEKRLKEGDDVEVEIGNEESRGDHSSLSLSSSTSLSLKTPFVDVQTEKRGLQRRITNRRKITEDEFGAAVNRRQMEGLSSFAPVQQGLSETADTEGFTMGLSKLGKHDITTDIVNCNTALYAQSDAVDSNFSIVATQDKPTVMASQLQRQIREMEQEEKINLWKEKSTYAFPTEEWAGAQPQLDKSTEAAQSQKDNRNSAASGQYEDTANMSKSVEGLAESQTSVRHDTLECEEEENRVKAQKEEEPQSAEDAVTMSQSEEDKVAEDTRTKEEDDIVDSETEQDDRIEPEEDVAPFSQSASEEGEVEPDSQTEDGGTVDCQEDVEARSQSAEDDNMVESKTEDEHKGKQQEEEENQQGSRQLIHDLEHISRRVHRSEGGLIMPVTEAGRDLADAREAGWGDGKSKAHSTIDLHSSLETENRDSSQLHTGIPDVDESSTEEQKDDSYTLAKPVAGKENSVNPQEVMHDIENSSHLSDSSFDEAAAQDAADKEAVREDEEDDQESIEEFPCKTPAFVREKMNFFRTHPQASTSVIKNIQASATNEASPAAKSKQVRLRKREPAEKKPGLPKSYLMAVFKHFAKTKVSADVYPILKEIMDKFFDRLVEDLETYAHHAKRNTIEFEDTVLLLKRQGYVNDKVPVEVLIEKYLRMDQRRLLIPIATSGNVVIPKKRR